MKRENRKAFPKLVRRPRVFDANFENADLADITVAVQKCDCANPNPGLTETEGPVDDNCFVDQYSLCGTLESALGPKTFFIRASDNNPSFIFVPAYGTNGACFSKGDQIPCSEAFGNVLGVEDYLPMDSTASASPCDAPQCQDASCPWRLLEVCDNDPAVESVTPQRIAIPTSFFGGLFGSRTVLYRGHCYTTPTDSCLSDDEAAEETKPDLGEVTKITTQGCNNQSCQCCGGAPSLMDLLVAGIADRIKFVNNGVLPTVVGHDWNDSAYILNEVLTYGTLFANGNTPETPCVDRAETFRLILSECDYWLGFSAYLYASGRWVNTDVHSGGDISGIGNMGAVTYFNGVNYNTQITAAPSHTWIRFAFGGPNTGGEVYTEGGEGGFGTTDAIRFGDLSPHVVVNSTTDPAFCNLVNSTLNRLLTALQKLMCVIVGGSVVGIGGFGSSIESRGGNGTSGVSCDEAIDAANVQWNANAWVPTLNLLGMFENTRTQFSPPFETHISSRRGKIYVDVSIYPDATVVVYLKVSPIGDGSSNSPPVAADNLFHAFDSGSGPIYLSAALANNIPVFTSFCTTPNTTKGWEVVDSGGHGPIGVVFGSFSV